MIPTLRGGPIPPRPSLRSSPNTTTTQPAPGGTRGNHKMKTTHNNSSSPWFAEPIPQTIEVRIEPNESLTGWKHPWASPEKALPKRGLVRFGRRVSSSGIEFYREWMEVRFEEAPSLGEQFNQRFDLSLVSGAESYEPAPKARIPMSLMGHAHIYTERETETEWQPAWVALRKDFDSLGKAIDGVWIKSGETIS